MINTPALNANQQKLVTDNLGFAQSRTIKFMKSRRIDFSLKDDLLNQGLLGMCRAALTFDPKRNVKFVTYAEPWISLFLKRGWLKINSIIRPPYQNRHGQPQRVFSFENDTDENFLENIEAEDDHNFQQLEAKLDLEKIGKWARTNLVKRGYSVRDIEWFVECVHQRKSMREISSNYNVKIYTVRHAVTKVQKAVKRAISRNVI